MLSYFRYMKAKQRKCIAKHASVRYVTNALNVVILVTLAVHWKKKCPIKVFRYAFKVRVLLKAHALDSYAHLSSRSWRHCYYFVNDSLSIVQCSVAWKHWKPTWGISLTLSKPTIYYCLIVYLILNANVRLVDPLSLIILPHVWVVATLPMNYTVTLRILVRLLHRRSSL